MLGGSSWPPDFVNVPNFLVIQGLPEDDQFIHAAIEIAHPRPTMPGS
jgi:hypothetical protein